MKITKTFLKITAKAQNEENKEVEIGLTQEMTWNNDYSDQIISRSILECIDTIENSGYKIHKGTTEIKMSELKTQDLNEVLEAPKQEETKTETPKKKSRYAL